jgi:uncharacterized protein (TIGR03437 family)
MRSRLILLMLLGLCTFGQDVGSGPVSEAVRGEFLRAFFRNGFHTLVALPPLGDVRKLGATGLVQEFQDTAKTQGVRYALVKADATSVSGESGETVFQLYPDMYSYFSQVGVNTAGYPTTDNIRCSHTGTGTCFYQLFDKSYALFVYSPPLISGGSFSVKEAFFTRWRTLGGAGGLGTAVSGEETVTSGAGTGVTATLQRFSAGALYSITSGTFSGRMLAVRQPVYDLYASNNAHTGFLGLPTGDELILPNNRRQQNFEGGAIEYEPGQTPVLRLQVATVTVSVSAPKDRLNLGETIQLQAATFAGNGAALEGRAVSWVSTNNRVLTVDPTGTTVTVRAVGGGSANITAISEGKSSRPLTFFVTAPCCQIGEGAPNSSIQQMFVDAVTRNRLNVRVPSPSPVRRTGSGFVQELLPADEASTARYLVAKPDSLATAFLVTGNLLGRYMALGGPAGSLGFPVADATARGRQVFQGGALAGDPPQQVTGAILARWATQNYETGPAGLPSGVQEPVLSFIATLGVAQPFAGGLFAAHQSGALNNRAFLVSGQILAKYLRMTGPSGTLGLPVGDEFGVSGRRHQDFEGGVIEYTPGAAEAEARENDRRPQISATPSAVAAGSRVRIAAGGFPAGATLRISVGGQPDFLVETQTGAYAWEILVPANAPSEVVPLRAADVGGRGLAVGSYIIQSAAETQAKLTKVRGDLQTGLPGSRLPLPLRITVTDGNNNPLAGVRVRFNPSPGAQIEDASAVSDSNGEAQAFLRLPLAELPALATAEAGRQVVTFSARSAAGSLTNLPRFTQAQSGDTKLGNENTTIAQKGALLVSAASILRYLQNNGELPAPNGQAEPSLLNRFMKDLCLFDAQGDKVCDGFVAPAAAPERNLNLWRLAAFVNGAIDVVPIAGELDTIRDALGRGVPALLALSVSTGETALGSHFVVALGVTSSGGVLIHDPNSNWGRTQLGDYLNGFSTAGRPYKATLVAALELAPRTPSALGFLVVTAGVPVEVTSVQGACGFGIGWPDTAVAPGEVPSQPPSAVQFRYCDGLQPSYQLDLPGSGPQRFVLTDLGNVAGRTESAPQGPAAFRLARPASNWTAAVQSLSFTAREVVNAASFTPELAPGGLASVFGSGLALRGSETQVEVGGFPAVVLVATSFQLNFRIPPELGPGSHPLRIRSAFGEQEIRVELAEVAPALFTFPGARAAALNQDGSVHTASQPARRGQVIVLYVTGLGATDRRGSLDVVRTPVQVLLDSREVDVLFAGAAPGYPGLYQINALLPQDLPPNLAARLVVRQGGRASNPAFVAVQ